MDSPKLIFSVITVDEESQLAYVFGIESIPALVYLPESHSVEAVSVCSVGETYFSEEEREMRVFEVDNVFLSESAMVHFIEHSTDVSVPIPSLLECRWRWRRVISSRRS